LIMNNKYDKFSEEVSRINKIYRELGEMEAW